MRILQLANSLDMGGLEVLVVSLSNAIVASGHDVHLGVLSHGGVLSDAPVFQKKWIGGVLGTGKVEYIRAVISLVRYVRREGISLIHAHNVRSGVFGGLACMFTRTPCVYTVHGRGHPGESLAPPICRLACRSIVAVSSDVADVLLSQGVSPERVRVVLNGVDPEVSTSDNGMDREACRVLCGLPPDALVVGSVGRLSAEKNYELLIRSFGALVKDNGGSLDGRPLVLVIVGGGHQRELLDRVICGSGLSHCVIMAGEQRDVLPWYRSMDVFCLTSLTEGTPVTLLEASANAIPSVVTDVGGNRDVLDDGRAGMLVGEMSENAVAHALSALLHSSEERQRLGAAARNRVREHYSRKQMVESYLQLYAAAAK